MFFQKQAGQQHGDRGIERGDDDRFVEAISVIKGLMADGPFSFSGEHYTISGHDGLPKPVPRPHPPPWQESNELRF